MDFHCCHKFSPAIAFHCLSHYDTRIAIAIITLLLLLQFHLPDCNWFCHCHWYHNIAASIAITTLPSLLMLHLGDSHCLCRYPRCAFPLLSHYDTGITVVPICPPRCRWDYHCLSHSHWCHNIADAIAITTLPSFSIAVPITTLLLYLPLIVPHCSPRCHCINQIPNAFVIAFVSQLFCYHCDSHIAIAIAIKTLVTTLLLTL